MRSISYKIDTQSAADCHCTCMPTTFRCMDCVDRPRHQRSQQTSQIALKQPCPGCDQTGFTQDRDPVVCDHTTSVINVTTIDRFDGCTITPVQSATRELGIYIDYDCRCGRMFNVQCFTMLRQIVALYVGHHSDASGRTDALPARA